MLDFCLAPVLARDVALVSLARFIGVASHYLPNYLG